MADIVQRVNRIEESVRVVVKGFDAVKKSRQHRGVSISRIAHAVFDFFAPVSTSISASEQYSLLPAHKRNIAE